MVFQMSAKSGAIASAPETFAAMFRSSYTLSLVKTRRIELQLEEMLRVFAEQKLHAVWRRLLKEMTMAQDQIHRNNGGSHFWR